MQLSKLAKIRCLNKYEHSAGRCECLKKINPVVVTSSFLFVCGYANLLIFIQVCNIP